MVGDVKKCIDIRIDFLSQYYVVPQEMQSEVDSFMEELVVLGESCFNAAEFEGRFASAGLSDRFNAILPKCTPRPAKMTKEQKRESRKIAGEMIAGNKKEFIKDALSDAAGYVMTDVKGELIKENRERMIEEGTSGDYTRTTNAADDVKRITRFFAKKFNR